MNIEENYYSEQLIKAAADGDLDTIRMCIKNDADINYKQHIYLQTPLIEAIANNHIEAVKLLLSLGADPNLKSRFNDIPPLNIAAFQERVEAVKYLLICDANPNSIDKEHHTPLMNASYNANTKIVKLLLQAGADPNIKDKTGWNALKWVLQNRTLAGLEVIKLLFRAGVDLDSPDHEGETPLMLASLTSTFTEYVKLLLEEGADPTLKNKKGQTALMIAINTGNDEKANLLQSNLNKYHYIGTLRKITRLLSQGMRDKNSNLSKLPKDILSKIALFSSESDKQNISAGSYNYSTKSKLSSLFFKKPPTDGHAIKEERKETMRLKKQL